jgi:hypothetical protein
MSCYKASLEGASEFSSFTVPTSKYPLSTNRSVLPAFNGGSCDPSEPNTIQPGLPKEQRMQSMRLPKAGCRKQ